MVRADHSIQRGSRRRTTPPQYNASGRARTSLPGTRSRGSSGRARRRSYARDGRARCSTRSLISAGSTPALSSTSRAPWPAGATQKCSSSSCGHRTYTPHHHRRSGAPRVATHTHARARVHGGMARGAGTGRRDAQQLTAGSGRRPPGCVTAHRANGSVRDDLRARFPLLLRPHGGSPSPESGTEEAPPVSRAVPRAHLSSGSKLNLTITDAEIFFALFAAGAGYVRYGTYTV